MKTSRSRGGIVLAAAGALLGVLPAGCQSTGWFAAHKTATPSAPTVVTTSCHFEKEEPGGVKQAVYEEPAPMS